MKKLKSSRGETLVETLVAILTVTLASLLFLQMTNSAASINRSTAAADETFQADLSAAEIQSGAASSGTVTLQNGAASYSYGVDVYTSSDGNLTSYAAEGGAS
ncbi:MAG: hypothetical protein LKJ86_09085 [Oscillibacter sp.]|jgi:competence protein ComGC|nr:hypothetical protein [Oscillibacter sp.]